MDTSKYAVKRISVNEARIGTLAYYVFTKYRFMWDTLREPR